MTTEIALTSEQVTAFAERLGIAPEEFTVDGALAKLDDKARTLAEGEIVVPATEYAELKAGAEAGASAAQRLYEMERDQFLSDAVRDGRITPGDLDKWVARYNDNTEMTREIVSDLQPVEQFVREFGREEQGGEYEDALADAFDAYMGVTAEDGR